MKGKVYGLGIDTDEKIKHNEALYQKMLENVGGSYALRSVDIEILTFVGVNRMALSSYKKYGM